MSYVEKLQIQAFRSGVRGQTKESLEWFRKRLRSVTRINGTKILEDGAFKKVTKPRIGGMYMYFYDPKHKETLPFYDKFPLIILLDVTPTGFTGLNLHYLQPLYRAKFFDKLMDFTNNKKYDNTTKFRLTYQFLKSASKMKEFQACYKQYLTKHVKTKIVEVASTEWETVVFLPTDQFVYNTRNTVWRKMREKYIK
jgi:hypothetical protein